MPDALRFLRRIEPQPRRWNGSSRRSRSWESFYRERWAHDRVVRSTHGVNCTGSCSWKVYVKDGIVAWETQQTDYPANGADEPDYEPRGCPRGASFSWYVYSPLRVRHPYVRGTLLERWREARTRLDPLDAWAEISAEPVWRAERGKGGLERASWDEATELVAACLGSTIERYGPDRIAAFSPIPAMSMASYTAGARFFSLLGAPLLSFYDWYCDLPPASPQVFGDQTDVPESADWFNAGYLILWGSNVPMTRTPDAHFMTEARYRGQKVAVVSPDYSQHTKFADTWLPAQAGTDGALAMAMGHVILKEFWTERRVPRFEEYARRFTDLPFLVTLERRGERYVPGRFLQASDLGSSEEHAEWKPALWDANRDAPAVPTGSAGHRWDGSGEWNLKIDDLRPRLSLEGTGSEDVVIELPAFQESGVFTTPLLRGVPARRAGGQLVTTVFDLLLAQYGVHEAAGYDDADVPYTPAWQEAITGVDRGDCIRVARELAANAEATGGRSMIVLGAGVNHWYHGDTAYRAILSLLLLTGCQGVNGGGWAHYVGQEKVRPITGFSSLAFALDWARPPRQQAATPYWYLATEQYRYDELDFDGQSAFDLHAKAVRLGWLPSYPQFDRSPLDLSPDEALAGLRDGSLRFACESPSARENWPRALILWRANLLGASSKGHEYFLEHLLPQRPPRRAGRRQSPHPARHRLRLPRPGQTRRGAARPERQGTGGRSQQPDADPSQADAHDRRLRAARVRLQLLRPDRRAARRARLHPQARRGGVVKVRAQLAMVMNLDKCIGCHTCSVTCKNVWTSRPGIEYAWFNNVETKPGVGYPREWEDQERWQGGWELGEDGRLRLKAGGRLEKLARMFANPDLPAIEDYYEPCGAPWIYQAHTLASLALFALWPFSRLVHVWTAPVLYVVRRSHILYRASPVTSPS